MSVTSLLFVLTIITLRIVRGIINIVDADADASVKILWVSKRIYLTILLDKLDLTLALGSRPKAT